MTASPKWQFWVDRGGTFTDCLGISPEGAVRTTKVLSSDRAPLEAIAKLAAEFDAGPLETLDADVKLGTTVATNALLERRGVPTAILTTAGLSGVFDIGTQERPELFVLEIERPARLQRWRLETPGRRAATGEVVEALDLEHARGGLAASLGSMGRRKRAAGSPQVAPAGLGAAPAGLSSPAPSSSGTSAGKARRRAGSLCAAARARRRRARLSRPPGHRRSGARRPRRSRRPRRPRSPSPPSARPQLSSGRPRRRRRRR